MTSSGRVRSTLLSVRSFVVRDVIRRLVALIALAFAVAPLITTHLYPLEDQAFPDSPVYADTAFEIANGNGFETRIDEAVPPHEQRLDSELRPSRYPPGFSLALAPFVRFGSNSVTDAQEGGRVLVILLVITLFTVAWVLGGPLAAAIAALITMVSPFMERSAQLLMSDAFGALLSMLMLLAVTLALKQPRAAPSPASGAPERAHDVRGVVQSGLLVLAGALAGYGVLTRFSAISSLVAVLVCLRRWRNLRLLLVGAIPVLIFLATYQWTEFGSPLRTGYDYYFPGLKLFGWSHVTQTSAPGERVYIFNDRLQGAWMRWTCPCDALGPMGKANNLVFYPAVLLGLYWIYFPPLFTVFGVWEIWRRRRDAATRLAAAIIVLNVAIFVGYYTQAGRFVAPAAYALLAYSAAGVARIVEGVSSWLRGLIRKGRGGDAGTQVGGESIDDGHQRPADLNDASINSSSHTTPLAAST